MAPRGDVPKLAEIAGEYLKKGAKVYLGASCRPASGRISRPDRHHRDHRRRDADARQSWRQRRLRTVTVPFFGTPADLS